jgi:hypothetical protein
MSYLYHKQQTGTNESKYSGTPFDDPWTDVQFQKFQVDLSVKLPLFNIFLGLVLKFTDPKRSV